MTLGLAALTIAYALRLAERGAPPRNAELAALGALGLLVGMLKAPLPLVMLAALVIVWPVLGRHRGRVGRVAVIAIPAIVAAAWWNVETDAAYTAARNAFSQPIEPNALAVTAIIEDPTAAAVPSIAPVSTIPLAPSIPPPPKPRQPEKMSVYPPPADRERLARIKASYRVGESFVVEYALEKLFATTSDEDIATEIRRRGHSLRRAR